MNLPDPTSRWFLRTAFGVMIGAGMGLVLSPWQAVLFGLVIATVLAALGHGHAVIGALLMAGVFSGYAANVSDQQILQAEVPVGRVDLLVEVMTDPRSGPYEQFVLVEPLELDGTPWAGPRLLASGGGVATLAMGQRVEISGIVKPSPGSARGKPYAGTVAVKSVTSGRLVGMYSPAHQVRQHVLGNLDPHSSPGAALLAGFLIGDTSSMDPVDLDHLRASGLTHFVAVSGSNVAMFLAGWWVLSIPFTRTQRSRAITGIVGLTLFVTITRFEPSVVRASVMAAIILLGRVVGLPINAWRATSLAVVGLVIWDGHLAASVGFQLSVAATLGLLVGGRMFAHLPVQFLARPLGVSVAAQVAVAPILLWYFGEVPVLAPITNLVAAPLVTASTMVGGIGTLVGYERAVWLGVELAELVLTTAERAAGGPAVGWLGAVGVVTAGWALQWRPARWLVGFGVVVLMAGPILGQRDLTGPAVVFFDVGQGDAALVIAPGGETILFDSGPDPTRLARALREHGVTSLDLVVLSHRHEDHVGGMAGIIGRIPIGEVWFVDRTEEEAFMPVRQQLDALAIPRRQPAVGEVWRVEGLELIVRAPVRHYAGANDESIVITVDTGIHRILFSGDIEEAAQRDLGTFGATILKVPHHGAGTSDSSWLEHNAGVLAVIQVGENTFGHPAQWVIETLSRSGALICRNDQHGHIYIDLLLPAEGCDLHSPQ